MTQKNHTSPLAVTDTDATSPRSRSGSAWLLTGFALAAAALAAWQFAPRLSTWWSDSAAQAEPSPLDDRLAAIERELDGLRQSLRQLDRRVADNAATQRVLRDEVLGIGERAALLEESVARLTDPLPRGDHALRLDEAELLLALGLQRLQLAGDAAAALRAYALAEHALAGLDDPAYISLRQTLAQELAALRALPEDPRLRAAGELDALEAALDSLPLATPAPQTEPSGIGRLISRLIEVRPSGEADLLAPADRDLGLTALRLELALARGALERRDRSGFDAALTRILAWLPRLYPPSPARDERLQRLQALRGRALELDLPVLGSTLEQLRRQRDSRGTRRENGA